jgi:hypothetical protein
MSKWFSHYHESQFLFLNDLLLAPVFMLIVYFWARHYSLKKNNALYTQYFVVALMIRLFSSVLLALVYQYYYDGHGDTHTYFAYVQRIREVASIDTHAFIDFAFKPTHDLFLVSTYFESGSAFFVNQSSNLVIKLALYLSYPLLNTYMLISFVFSIFCFYGCWKIFILFTELYPHLYKQFAIACLFLPSVCFWGTGILKDPLCLGALGTLTYHLYKLIFQRTKIIRRLIVVIICFWMLKTLKVYIILSFMPAYTFWLIFRYKNLISSKFIKTMMSPILFILSISLGVFVFIKIAQYSHRYAFDNLVRTAKDTQNWLYYSTQIQGGSGYTLGNIEYTSWGLLKVFPKAVNVSLFRPYIWEARKPILIPAALEGFISLFLTIRLLYKTGFIRFTKLILTNPEVQFCLVFSIIFAFSVGFTSYNFGTLVRYKIPLMPFYFIALFILADKDKEPEIKTKKQFLDKKASSKIAVT